MPGSETREEKMFFMETIKRIVREVNNDKRKKPGEPDALRYMLDDDMYPGSTNYNPFLDPANPACPAYADNLPEPADDD